MRVLVAGDGPVAESTVTALLQQGHQVRLLSPHAEAAARLWPHGVEPWVAKPSARQPEGAADGCAAVLQLGAIRETWSAAAKGMSASASVRSRVDLRGTRGLIAEAERAKAERFVLLSSLRYERSATDDGRALRDAEKLARDFRGVWSILRAGLVYAPGEGALDAIALMVRTLPAIPLVDGGQREVQPLWHEDLGLALARSVDAPQAAARVLHVAGPERILLSDLVDALCAIVGRHPARVAVPSLLAAMGADAAALLGVRLPARAAALSELDGDALLSPAVENALTSVLGVTPTMVREGLRKLVATVPEQGVATTDGTVRRRRFWVEITGSHRTARELRDEFRRHATHVLSLENGPPEGQMIKKGALLSAHVPLRGFVALRVADVAPDRVTALTVEGDPLAGIVTVRFLNQGRVMRVEVVVEAGATTLVDSVLAEVAGGALEDLDWPGALERIVELSGGQVREGVQRDVVTLDEDEATQVRERADRMRVTRARDRAPQVERPRTMEPAAVAAATKPPAARRKRAARRPATGATSPARKARTRRPAKPSASD